MAVTIEDLRECIDNYIEETRPKSLMGLMNKEVLRNLLRGYSAALSSGIAVYYSEVNSELATVENICLFRADEDIEQMLKLFHPICGEYRKDGKHEEKCTKYDREIALKYYKGTWTEPKIYRCHLQLWDVAYPLFVEDMLLGVLYSGQIVMKSRDIDWRKEFDGLAIEMSWENFDSNNRDQLQDILDACNSEVLVNKEQFKEEVEKGHGRGEGRYYLGVEEVYERCESFLEFGNMITTMLDDLNRSRKEAATQKLMHEIDEYLTDTVDLSSQKNWEKACEKLLKEFANKGIFEQIWIYARNKSYFETWLSTDTDNQEDIKGKDILPVVKINTLHQLRRETDKEKKLLEKLNLGMENIWVYLSEVRTSSGIISSLIVVKGDITDKNIMLAGVFCKTIGIHSDNALLIFRLQEQQREFREYVSDLAHSFRTPMEAVSLDLGNLAWVVKGDEKMARFVSESENRLNGALIDLTELLHETKEKRIKQNLVPVVNEVINLLKPIADKHPCQLIKEGNWPLEANVSMNRSVVRRALMELIENAIKYSWSSGKQEYRVCIRIESINNFACFHVLNYGIGIPPNMMKRMQGMHERGNVPDGKRVRPGTGLGLAIAIKAVEEHDGWVEIESRPADDDYRSTSEKYHRYLTEVEVYLPLAK